ncbi:hypothetical protein ACTT2I_10545 [Stenotrophomonas sp. PUT21]|uniref:hypothetical protein n=1 Tax=Stenotrophomonas sp. PUT21 TaxID=3456954 RepID=UPI003FCE2F38
MKISPAVIPMTITDLAAYQLFTAPLTRDATNGMDHLADKVRRLRRLAGKARAERRWKKDEERFA